METLNRNSPKPKALMPQFTLHVDTLTARGPSSKMKQKAFFGVLRRNLFQQIRVQDLGFNGLGFGFGLQGFRV